MSVRAFPVRLPSGAMYWTVLDENLAVVPDADAFLRHVRFGRDGSELTTRSYAGGIALFLRWCGRTGRHWHAGLEHLGLFIIWLRHAGPEVSGVDVAAGGDVLSGPGREPVRGARRINAVLTAVRGFASHAVTSGRAPSGLMPLLYEVADDRDLPAQARSEDGRMSWRMRARHRLHEPEATVDRASDQDVVALLLACRSARDRLIVLLMVRAGLRRGELCGLRRSDVHLLPDARLLGCAVERPHMHVVRRDNPNGAWAKSRRPRVVPLDFLLVRAFDAYEFERLGVPRAADNDFVFVNLFREPIGAAMPPDAINTLITAAGRRAGIAQTVRPHQLRHAFASNVADAGGGLDEIADLLGHASLSSSQVYLHPDPGRLRAAIDRVPSPPHGHGGAEVTAPSVIGSAAMAALPGSVVSDATVGVAVDARHVLGVGGAVDPATARLAALIDPGFLTGAGWDAASRVLSLPPGHPLLGWSVCETARCTNQVYRGHRTCGACQAGQDDSLSDDTVAAESAQRCQVDACPRDRRNRRYCRAHYERLLDRRRDPGFDERRWRRLEPAVEDSGQVSLHGIPELVVVQVLYGLQERTREGSKTGVATLRQVGWELRLLQPGSVEHVAVQAHREHHKLVSCFARHVRRAFLRPETERVKDVWDLVAFGLSGRLDFTKISQPWLREAAKRWAADDLPRRRGKATAGPVQHYLVSLAALSEGLRAARPDRGETPNALGRGDIESFLHRLAFLVADGQVSTDARTRICREVKHLLGRFRSLGLTRPGGPAARLGEDFTLSTGDVPVKPEDPEANRDLPAEIMQALCRHLQALELAVSCREIRVAVELVIDTGRRPDEICSLVWDCLEYDEHDRLPVLIYDNHKSARLGRRLPIAQATAELITAQKDRVRAQFPDTPLAELKLLPAAYSNPDGRRAVTETQLTTRHRKWIKSLPPILRADGTEYDKTKIVPYAYRHTYAQRHADAGVPIDVLATLMDHRSLNTTKHYYRVGEARRRDAVDRVTALQFDRHGNRLWRTVQTLLDTEQARRAIGEVAVPYGVCGEPSNVQAGGHACPYRFRCVGCDHFRTDISYLPDLQAYLDDLLRSREKLLAASDVDDWARQEATPSTEEITRIRRLIARINTGLDELTADQRDQIEQAVAVVRRHRTVLIGMPRIRQTMLDVHPERTA